MPVSNGVISAPVSVADVSSCIGELSLDVATLCSSSKINRWNKYKPVRVNKVYEINDSDRASANQGFDLSNTSVNASNINILKNQYTNTASFVWPYNLVRPGTDWSRLTDFVGYNHNALPPLELASTEIIWDTSQTSLTNLSITSFFRLSSGYFGPPVLMQLCLDEFEFGQSVGTGFSNLYLAIVYFYYPNVANQTDYCCAISEYPIRGGSSTPPIIYPGRFTNFANLLNGMTIGSSIKCMAVMTPQGSAPTGTSNRSASLGFPCYRYPTGGIFTITKINTPAWLWTAKDVIEVYYWTDNYGSNYKDGYNYINLLTTTSSGFRQIARRSGQMHTLVLIATIRNERSVSQTLQAGGCQLIFCKTGTNGATIRGNEQFSVNGYSYPGFFCSSFLTNYGNGENRISRGNLVSQVTVSANASITMGFVLNLSWDKMNELFPYNSSQPSTTASNCPILLRIGSGKPYIGTKLSSTQYSYNETLSNYNYYWRISQ